MDLTFRIFQNQFAFSTPEYGILYKCYRPHNQIKSDILVHLFLRHSMENNRYNFFSAMRKENIYSCTEKCSVHVHMLVYTNSRNNAANLLLQKVPEIQGLS